MKAAVITGASAAARKGKTVWTPKAFYKLYRVLAKLLPTKVMMNFSRT